MRSCFRCRWLVPKQIIVTRFTPNLFDAAFEQIRVDECLTTCCICNSPSCIIMSTGKAIRIDHIHADIRASGCANRIDPQRLVVGRFRWIEHIGRADGDECLSTMLYLFHLVHQLSHRLQDLPFQTGPDRVPVRLEPIDRGKHLPRISRGRCLTSRTSKSSRDRPVTSCPLSSTTTASTSTSSTRDLNCGCCGIAANAGGSNEIAASVKHARSAFLAILLSSDTARLTGQKKGRTPRGEVPDVRPELYQRASEPWSPRSPP